MYGLRKISKDGTNSYNDFVWPLKVGAEVEAPDWNPEPDCGGGLHCLPTASGGYYLLHGEYWAVLKFNKKDMVQIDSEKCKVKKCKIMFLSENPEGLLKYFDVSKFDSKTAYYWARDIGDRDIMINRIVNSSWALSWAVAIGDEDAMINLITTSEDAYEWAKFIGHRDIMINRITDPYYASLWIEKFGDKKTILQKFPELKKRLKK